MATETSSKPHTATLSRKRHAVRPYRRPNACAPDTSPPHSSRLTTSPSSAGALAATSVGRGASAAGTYSTAIGWFASASYQSSTAIGASATATAANQVTLGGSGSSVRIGDIAASTAAQVGPVSAVTVDGNGTLGKQSVVTTAELSSVTTAMVSSLEVTDQQFADLSGRVDDLSFRLDDMNHQTRAGIAAAMALGGTMVAPDSAISVNFNAATYRGEQGFSGSVVARLAPRIYVSGGVAGSTSKGSTGGRVGVTFGL